MKHLQTFESFIELNEAATKANPNDIKAGDLIRYQPTAQRGPNPMSSLKVAIYGKCTSANGGQFTMIGVGWSDKSKEQPEFAYIRNPGYVGGPTPGTYGNEFIEQYPSKISKIPEYQSFTSMPFSKFDWKEAIAAFPNIGNVSQDSTSKVKQCTIWKP